MDLQVALGSINTPLVSFFFLFGHLHNNKDEKNPVQERSDLIAGQELILDGSMDILFSLNGLFPLQGH